MEDRLAVCLHSDGTNLCFCMRDGLKDSVGLLHFCCITGDPHCGASIYRSLLLAWLRPLGKFLVKFKPTVLTANWLQIHIYKHGAGLECFVVVAAVVVFRHIEISLDSME